MTTYTYSLDTPSDDPVENKRLGYRTPRSILLPPYLSINPYFSEFMDAIDEMFEDAIDKPTEALQALRNMWVTNPKLEANQIADSQLIPFDQWSQPEREILVKQVNALGMKLQNAGVISTDSYQVISRWVGQYWFEKGTENFINFINYCLSSTLQVNKLWTQDYVSFVPEGDASIGTPIWEGGTWYPTTHVSVIAKGGLQKLDIKTLVSFFYEIANYNLVLQSVNLSYDIPVVDHLEEGYTLAKVVAIGLWANSSLVISNTMRYGIDGPPITDVSPPVPAGALMVNPNITDYSAVYMLAAPTAWIQDSDGDMIPAYGAANQTPTEGPEIPTSVCGGPSTTGDASGYSVLYGPVSWTPVPGSSRSKARIPGFTSVPTQRSAAQGTKIPSQIVGLNRNNLLVNPKGFKQIAGSTLWTPYW